MANQSLVKAGDLGLSWPRRAWNAYHDQDKWVRVLVPILSFSIAYGALQWSWSVLAQGEYGVALLLTLTFILVGIGAVLLIPKKLIKIPSLFIIVFVGIYSVAVIWNARGGKPWTTVRFFNATHEQPKPSPPSPPPSVQPSATPPASVPSPTPKPVSLRPKRHSPTQRPSPCGWKDTLLGRCA